ncbi:TniB family NTP-binding protein [Knoellia sp. LjRoot47]|uniref:TniB family NTP-binding protein n=1 Tax=Knoellia sp. LjRoot47 TaxID=3342330 RepID=UPI003ED101A7
MPTPQQTQCEQLVRRTQGRAAHNLEGAQVALYVLGRPFLGKSTAVDRAALAIHREAIADSDMWVQGQPRLQHAAGHDAHMPVVRVLVRPDAQRRAVVTHIVNFCGYGTQGSANELTDKVAEFVAKHGVRLVVLDDVHNLATDRRDAHKIYNTIKDLNTELGDQHVAFVYVGNPDAAGFGNLLEHEQLSSRLITLPMSPLGLDQNNLRSDETLAWQEYLTAWETALRPVLPDLNAGRLSADLGRALWAHTMGYAGGVALLLKDMAVEALEDPSPRRQLTVTMEALKAAHMPDKFVKELAKRRSAA